MNLSDGFYELTPGGVLRYRFHPGQYRAWLAAGRFVVILSGTQGGKTTFGPPWMHREIQQRGPGDYLVVTPTFALLDKKALPEFTKLFADYLGLGRYVGNPTRRFEISPLGQQRLWGDSGRAYKTTIWFGYASDPDSLESSTAKAAWLDEAGQQIFRVESYEAIMRRLAIHEGRMLITTTPYYWGWLKARFWDEPRAADVDLVHFESIMNPAFPRAEWERARRELPPWRFDMFYRARFTRPAGLIYGAFDVERHTCRPFAVPPDWPRYIGLDFGGVNTAAVFLAESPDGRLYLYREYHAGEETAAGHAVALLEGEPGEAEAFGGAPGEQQWRDEFRAAGLHVRRPVVSDVEVGINRVYSLIAADRLIVFDSCGGVLDELANYSRVTDEAGQPLEAIADKSKYHILDALRYVGSYLIDEGVPDAGVVAMPDPLEALTF